MSMPVKALRYDLLTPVPDTEGEITRSGHPVTKFSWTENGSLLTGCFKPIDSTYPPLLAKYSVAYSVWLRMIIGERAAEERLVYDKAGNIVGSMSIKLPKYRPLLGGLAGKNDTHKPGSTAEDVRFGIPDANTLEELNAAELLVADWLSQDDDRHYGNWSLDGTIDTDMRGYGITSIIKGIRWILREVELLIHKVMEIRREDLDNFPCIKGRTYWPANPLPGISESWKRYNLNPQAFRELAQRPTFVQQVFSVLLRVLVVWQPDVLRARLTEYLGDEKLDYKSLDTQKIDPNILEWLAGLFNGSPVPKSRKLEEQYGKFFNPEANEQPFVDHILGVFTAMHHEFRNIAVFYPGCDACEENVETQQPKRVAKPAFHRYILEHPEAWQAAKTWADAQNARIDLAASQACSSSTQELPSTHTRYDPALMERNYHEAWRDAFLPLLDANLSRFEQLVIRLRPAAPGSTTAAVPAASFVSPSSRPVGSAEAFSAARLVRPSPLGEGVLRFQDSTLSALAILTDTIDPHSGENRPGLISRMRACITRYANVLPEDLTREVSKAFGDELEDIKILLERNIRDKLAPDDNTLFNEALGELEALVPQVRFSRHVDREAGATFSLHSPLSSSSSALFAPPSCTDEKVINACINALFDWADCVEVESLNTCILTVVEDYEKTGGLTGGWTRQRGKDVREYLKASTEKGAQRLGWIFAGGSRDDGALNMALVSKLFPLMLDDVNTWSARGALPESFRVERASLEALREACKSPDASKGRRFDLAVPLYTQRTCEAAKTGERFMHAHIVGMEKRVNDSLYEWVSHQTPGVFNTLIISAIQVYESGGWTYPTLWGTKNTRTRGPGAKEILLQTQLPNTQKLGMLLSKEEGATHADSSLTSYILNHLINTMKQSPEVKTGPQYACVRDVQKQWWDTKLLPQIKALAELYANGVGPASASIGTSSPASSVPSSSVAAAPVSVPSPWSMAM